MSEENVEIVRRILHAPPETWARTPDLDPHVTFVVRPSFPEAGVYVGPDAVVDYMRVLLEQWQQFRLTTNALQPVGDTVMAEVIQHSQGKASGIEGEVRYFMLFTFRGGKVVRIETIRNEAEALAAAGLSE